MNTVLLFLSLIVGGGIVLLTGGSGAGAVALTAFLACVVIVILRHTEDEPTFLVQVFVGGLLVRTVIATIVFVLDLHQFFGPDALLYDGGGNDILRSWTGADLRVIAVNSETALNWGMNYFVAAIYMATGRSLLGVQLVNTVFGAATAPVIYLCARYVFENSQVARGASLLVGFFPSLVLWSSLALKDAVIVLALTLAILATLRLTTKLTMTYLVMLVAALLCVLIFRFYIFYILIAAIGGTLLIGNRSLSTQTLVRVLVLVLCVGLVLTYLGVLRTATNQIRQYASLERVQYSRSNISRAGEAGFGQDLDVSTTGGALRAIPVGVVYLLFAPFPWQMLNLRQSITLPEMIVWWLSFPLLLYGAWFTLKHRFRRALPILIFLAILTLAYSIYQGNVGTAYRQRAQLLVFYFIFVSVGFTLVRERIELWRKRDSVN